MMTSSCRSIFLVTGPLCAEFTGHRWILPHKGQWREALAFSLICARTNVWANDRGTILHAKFSRYDFLERDFLFQQNKSLFFSSGPNWWQISNDSGNAWIIFGISKKICIHFDKSARNYPGTWRLFKLKFLYNYKNLAYWVVMNLLQCQIFQYQC